MLRLNETIPVCNGELIVSSTIHRLTVWIVILYCLHCQLALTIHSP